MNFYEDIGHEMKVENMEEDKATFKCNYKCRLQSIELHFKSFKSFTFGDEMVSVSIQLTAVKHRSKQKFTVDNVRPDISFSLLRKMLAPVTV